MLYGLVTLATPLGFHIDHGCIIVCLSSKTRANMLAAAGIYHNSIIWYKRVYMRCYFAMIYVSEEKLEGSMAASIVTETVSIAMLA